MTGLSRRVRTLEATVCVPTWGGSFLKAQTFALSRMPPAERDLLHAVITHTAGAKIDFGCALWSRWENVFAKAVAETGCPFAITAIEMLF